ncbi:hypothetical protein BJX64DRAFT_294803 [Aspergillus heterothallicus]
MKLLRLIPASLLLASSTAQACCFEFDLAIPVSLTTPKFNVPNFTNSLESTAFLIASVSRNANASALLGGTAHIDRSYKIHFHKYWDFGGRETNYIAAANAAGYATLSYDRLGVGESEHADPYFDVQLGTQIAILKRITKLVRHGHLSKHIPIPVPDKIVHVGHSYGSLVTNGLVAGSPGISDGIVLTGFSHDPSWTTTLELCLGFEVARVNDAARFGALASGYLTWGREFANQCIFFKYPFFEIGDLERAEAGKAPFAIAELLLFTSVDLAAAGFEGRFLYMLSGQANLPFCGGDCHGILDGPDAQSPFVFPKARPFATYIHPDAAHGINLHHNASAAYGVVNSFLGENGL